MRQIKYVCPTCGHSWISDKHFSEEIQICDNCGKIDILPYSISLLNYYIEDMIIILNNEIKRRKEKGNVSIRYIWTTRNGDKVYIDEMTDSHLVNTKRMLERKAKTYYEEHSFDTF